MLSEISSLVTISFYTLIIICLVWAYYKISGFLKQIISYVEKIVKIIGKGVNDAGKKVSNTGKKTGKAISNTFS